MIVVKRNDEVAVLQVGAESQSIKAHGLYVPVEPGAVRGSMSLVKKLRAVDRIHLCRNEACVEEGGEHLCSRHSAKYMVERYKDKCSVTSCKRVGSKFHHGVLWCAEHEPRTALRTPTPPSQKADYLLAVFAGLWQRCESQIKCEELENLFDTLLCDSGCSS